MNSTGGIHLGHAAIRITEENNKILTGLDVVIEKVNL